MTDGLKKCGKPWNRHDYRGIASPSGTFILSFTQPRETESITSVWLVNKLSIPFLVVFHF